MPQEVSLEAEEWYVLCNWLSARENRLMYAIRPRSAEWEALHQLRLTVENQRGDAAETSGVLQTVRLSESEFALLKNILRRRARWLRFFPWRDRERRDVRHLRRHLIEEAESSSNPRIK